MPEDKAKAIERLQRRLRLIRHRIKYKQVGSDLAQELNDKAIIQALLVLLEDSNKET